MRRIALAIISCLLLVGLTLPGCTTEVDSLVTLTVSSTLGGSVTAPGEGAYSCDAGAVVDLLAEAEAGYEFARWTGDVDTIPNVNASSTTIMINGNYSITANFVAECVVTIDSTEGGDVTTPGEGTFTYDTGAVIDLVAEVEEGYKFVNWTGDVGSVKDVDAVQTTITMHGIYSITANFETKYTPMAAGGAFHTVGLKSDGTVVAAGYNEYGQSDVGSWMDIIQVAAGKWDTLGLRADGTLVSGGWSDYGQLNVGGWTDIVQVATSLFHTVGLRSDGTVVAAGSNGYRQCNVGGWTDIIQVAAGGQHTVGLKSNGTVVALGWNGYGQCDVGDWTDIIQVAAGYTSTVGIKSDGSLVTVGRNDYGQLNVGGWTDIIQVVAGEWHTVGLRSDGTLVAVGWNRDGQCDVGNWTDIIQIGGSSWHTVGVKSDGTVVAVGQNGWLQCEVGAWKLT